VKTPPRAVPFWSPEEVQASFRDTITHLNERRVLAYPTETVYGFGGGVDQESVRSLVALKSRPRGKPFLILVAGVDMLARLDLHMTHAASSLAARFWPGPLTLVLPGGDKRVPPELRGPEGGVGVRWTSHAALAQLIRAYGDPITSTSANLPGNPPADSAAVILRDWWDAVGRGRLRVLDGGTLQPSAPSTVVDCMGERPRVIRPGAIPLEDLRLAAPTLIPTA
jgi:L-threonylcarbamoyladenylate synthase